MKKAFIILFALLIGVAATYATESRIESMGKTDRFMLDEMAMFSNPASFVLYPNILTGSLGQYVDQEWPYSLSGQWFGAWTTINKVAVGAAFNRHDELESFLTSRSALSYKRDYGAMKYVLYDTTWNRDTVVAADTGDARYNIGGRTFIVDSLRYDIADVVVPKPVGEAEVFLGYNLGNMGVGLHVFRAAQDSVVNDDRIAASGVLKFDLGFLMKLSEKDFVDAAVTYGRLTYYSNDAIDALDEAQSSVSLSARAFLTVAQIGGQIVPSFKFSQASIVTDTILAVSPGVGYAREIEGGSFWAGVEYGFERERSTVFSVDADNEVVTSEDTATTNKFTFGFGIEKQIAWPWFTLRVGGRKTIKYNDQTVDGVGYESKSTNPDNDRSNDDLIGAGVSLKVGDRLRFDVSGNERLPYSNILNGTLESISPRISATYAF